MLANLIKQRMGELGIGQADLAQRSSLSRQYISDLVNEKRGRRISTLTQSKLARGLRLAPGRIAEAVAYAELESAKSEGRLVRAHSE